MNSINLQQSLNQFTGTEHYYRISKLHLLTDGTKFLADEAKCYWLMDAIASYLPKNFNDDFAVANLVVNDNKAELTLDDGNGNIFARQFIEYTDFPLPEVKIYCGFDGEY